MSGSRIGHRRAPIRDARSFRHIGPNRTSAPPFDCQGVVVIGSRATNPYTESRILPKADSPHRASWDALRQHPMYSISVHRSVLLRLTTCLWALWFGVVLAVPAALPTC